MTLNILFFTIEIRKREKSLMAALHDEQVEKLYEENKDRQISVHYFL